MTLSLVPTPTTVAVVPGMKSIIPEGEVMVLPDSIVLLHMAPSESVIPISLDD